MKTTPRTASKPTPKLVVKATAKPSAKPTAAAASKANSGKLSAKATAKGVPCPSPVTPKKPALTAKTKSPSVNQLLAKASTLTKAIPDLKASPTNKAAPAPSKQAQLIALLRSAEGCSLEHMTEVTGWQAHTVRGTISGVLRKRLGLNVRSALPVAGGPRVYRIVEQASKQPAGQAAKQASA